MFVAWQRKPLSEKGRRRSSWELDAGEACACPPDGLGREKLTPVVRRAFRAGGKPRSEVVTRPATGVRRCCLENAADPLARVWFWRAFERKRDEALRAADPDASPELVELYARRGAWLRAELAKVVRPPTEDERALWELFLWPGDTFDPATMVEDRKRRLAEARARLEAYKRGRRRGETPKAWWDRSIAEAEAERARRYAEEQAELRGRWTAWVYSPTGTAPPSTPVPPDWQELRDGWLHVEAASRTHSAAGWAKTSGGQRRTPPGGRQAPRSGGGAAMGGVVAAARALGVRWPCSADEAKAAFRRGALKAHPDRGGSDAAFVRLKAAYDEVCQSLGAA